MRNADDLSGARQCRHLVRDDTGGASPYPTSISSNTIVGSASCRAMADLIAGVALFPEGWWIGRMRCHGNDCKVVKVRVGIEGCAAAVESLEKLLTQIYYVTQYKKVYQHNRQ